MTDQMKAELNSMFKDILTVPLDSRRARMYVIMNSIDYKEGNGAATKAKTLFYEISNPHNLDYNQITRCEVIRNYEGTQARPNPKNPIQNPAFLKDKILTKNRIPVNDDEEVFFITWDHGSAFGIFREVDPGIADNAEIRKPIHYDLKRYPYLAEFWNKALEIDSDLKNMADPSNNPVFPSLIQIGHALFSVEATTAKSFSSEYSKLVTQTNLKINNKVASVHTQNLLLVFDTTTKDFEVSDDNFLNNKIQSKRSSKIKPGKGKRNFK